MCTCKFCGTSFSPRQQVKNPSACNLPSCQKARQAKNERDWHRRNHSLYLKNAKYHREQRIERHKIVSVLTDKFLAAILAGFTFKNISIDQKIFGIFFNDFINHIGLRQINKFYRGGDSFMNQGLTLTT